jgi:hypothetical protein
MKHKPVTKTSGPAQGDGSAEIARLKAELAQALRERIAEIVQARREIAEREREKEQQEKIDTALQEAHRAKLALVFQDSRLHRPFDRHSRVR